jgi:hypothetical protein
MYKSLDPYIEQKELAEHDQELCETIAEHLNTLLLRTKITNIISVSADKIVYANGDRKLCISLANEIKDL